MRACSVEARCQTRAPRAAQAAAQPPPRAAGRRASRATRRVRAATPRSQRVAHPQHACGALTCCVFSARSNTSTAPLALGCTSASLPALRSALACCALLRTSPTPAARARRRGSAHSRLFCKALPLPQAAACMTASQPTCRVARCAVSHSRSQRRMLLMRFCQCVRGQVACETRRAVFTAHGVRVRPVCPPCHALQRPPSAAAHSRSRSGAQQGSWPQAGAHDAQEKRREVHTLHAHTRRSAQRAEGRARTRGRPPGGPPRRRQLSCSAAQLSSARDAPASPPRAAAALTRCQRAWLHAPLSRSELAAPSACAPLPPHGVRRERRRRRRGRQRRQRQPVLAGQLRRGAGGGAAAGCSRRACGRRARRGRASAG
jgi:hypothetical protein